MEIENVHKSAPSRAFRFTHWCFRKYRVFLTSQLNVDIANSNMGNKRYLCYATGSRGLHLIFRHVLCDTLQVLHSHGTFWLLWLTKHLLGIFLGVYYLHWHLSGSYFSLITRIRLGQMTPQSFLYQYKESSGRFCPEVYIIIYFWGDFVHTQAF